MVVVTGRGWWVSTAVTEEKVVNGGDGEELKMVTSVGMVAKVARRSLGGRPPWRVYSESTRPCRPTFSEYSESTRPFTLLGTIPCSEYSESTRPCNPTFTTLIIINIKH